MASTLVDLLLTASTKFGPRPALGIRRNLRTSLWSYDDLVAAARRAGSLLNKAGLSPGDRVMVLAPNDPDLVATMFGVWMAGGVLVPVDARTPPEVVDRFREQTRPRLMVSLTRIDLAADLPVISPADLVREGEPRPLTLPPIRSFEENGTTRTEGLAEIVFTSGTTGAPKGVMLTHANILANVQSALETLPIEPGTRLLSLLPLSHMLEQTPGLLAALGSGATIFYLTSRRSTAVVAALQRHHIGLIVCVPEVLRLLLSGIEREVERSGQQRRWQRLMALADRLPMAVRPALFAAVHARLGGRLRLVLCGGSRLDTEVWQAWERLGVRVVQGYGTTECAPIVASNRFDRRLPTGVGWPVLGVSVRLAQDGEVLVHGPNVMPGYWRDPEATAAVLQDGWYRTGDIAAVGSRGSLQLLGRKKEMIVLEDGRNVFPQDVEDVLRLEPAVRDCVVLGRPNLRRGEQVHAVVIPLDGTNSVSGAVRRANARLGSHQQITGFTVWTYGDFPRTLSLKVKRKEVLAAIGRPESTGPTSPTPSGEDSRSRLLRAVAQAAGRPVTSVFPDADLSLDLGLDSLARIELGVLLEEEFGRTVSDDDLVGCRTVADLLGAVERAEMGSRSEPLPAWPRSALARIVRSLAQDLALFPMLRLVCRPLRTTGQEWLTGLRGPVLLVANHSSHLDSPTVLSLLPRRLRRDTAVAAASDYFFTTLPRSVFASLVLGAFPFHRVGPVASSLAHCGDLVDAGLSILVFPEGTRSVDGRLQPLKAGIGLLARDLGIPVVPIGLQGLYAILPKGRSIPRPGPVHVAVGAPLHVDPGLTNIEAAQMLERALRALLSERPEAVAGGHEGLRAER